MRRRTAEPWQCTASRFTCPRGKACMGCMIGKHAHPWPWHARRACRSMPALPCAPATADGHACAQPLDLQLQVWAGPSQSRFGARALEVQRVARPELVVSHLHTCCPLMRDTAETRRRTAAGREELRRMCCARPPLAFAVPLRVSSLLRRSPSRFASVSPPCSVARPHSRFVYGPDQVVEGVVLGSDEEQGRRCLSGILGEVELREAHVAQQVGSAVLEGSLPRESG